MPTVKVNGINLYYEVSGQGHPLILIMGLRRNISWWYRQMPELSRHFTVIAFDNRGAGRSDKPVMEYSIGLFADDTAGLMNALDIKNAHVLGISMGGYIAQELAIRHPEMVRSLVLVNSIGGSSWKSGRTLRSITERPLWDWGLHFPGDVWPLRQATRVLPVVAEDLLPNLVRNPRAIIKVANLARRERRAFFGTRKTKGATG